MNSQSLFLNSPIEGVELFDFQELITQEVPELDIILRPQGKQMEFLMAEAIRRSERYELLVHGLQVPAKGLTKGELDFLIFDRQIERVIHMEMVYKFYIYDAEEGAGPWGPWIGPGRKDRMIWKLAHLTDHQFPILNHPETRPLLEDLGIDASSVLQQLCFLGELYLPWGKAPEYSNQLNPSALKGDWMTIESSRSLEQVIGDCPEKPDWILPFDHSIAKPLNEITLEVSEMVRGGRPALLWILEGDVEKKRFLTAT